ncbi:hypothetical protein pb186bvf_021093 [Paramecium bursaria]
MSIYKRIMFSEITLEMIKKFKGMKNHKQIKSSKVRFKQKTIGNNLYDIIVLLIRQINKQLNILMNKYFIY